MKNIYLLFITTLILFTNCKNSTEEKPLKDELIEAEEVLEQLEIGFSFKTNKTDVFKIMMNNIKVDELQQKNIQIFETVSPSSQVENIKAVFDAGNISKKIVFNLGTKKVKEVIIDNINISYKSKVINISTPNEMAKFLKFNKYVVADSTSKVIKTKKVDGKHSPTFTFSKRLLNQLNIK